ncbi:MAG: hypothetical protein JWQ14_2096 [Adhaeribacter sp.]|nr:hypothetical protein [Adhaeribacter sp.]
MPEAGSCTNKKLNKIPLPVLSDFYLFRLLRPALFLYWFTALDHHDYSGAYKSGKRILLAASCRVVRS